MKKRNRPLLTAGLSSLLLIFISLCLLTFAVLSLVSARADLRLSQKIADRTQTYYEASNQANTVLADLDRIFAAQYEAAENEEAFFAGLSEALSEVAAVHAGDSEVPDGFPAVFSPANRLVSFAVPINEDQILSVSLLISFPKGSGETFYTIKQWKTVNTSDWTPDTRQNLYQAPQ